MGFGIENIRDDLRSAAPGDTLRAAIVEIGAGSRCSRANLHLKQASQKGEFDSLCGVASSALQIDVASEESASSTATTLLEYFCIGTYLQSTCTAITF